MVESVVDWDEELEPLCVTPLAMEVPSVEAGRQGRIHRGSKINPFRSGDYETKRIRKIFGYLI